MVLIIVVVEFMLIFPLVQLFFEPVSFHVHRERPVAGPPLGERDRSAAVWTQVREVKFFY